MSGFHRDQADIACTNVEAQRGVSSRMKDGLRGGGDGGAGAGCTQFVHGRRRMTYGGGEGGECYRAVPFLTPWYEYGFFARFSEKCFQSWNFFVRQGSSRGALMGFFHGTSKLPWEVSADCFSR